MKLAVKDANVLIDLVEADLLGHWFKLGIETHTTDLVLHEVTHPQQSELVRQFVKAGLLKVHSLGPDSIPTTAAISGQWRVSIADASAIFLAQQLKAALLSGDGPVRKAATALKIEIHGVLWVLDQLVEHSVLPRLHAHASLTLLIKGNCFLPKQDCAERLKRWGTG